MGRLRKYGIMALVVLCSLMQLALTMPHHHHGDSEVVCLNFTHLAHDHHDCHSAGHDHSHQHTTTCGTTTLEFAEPELRTLKAPTESCIVLNDVVVEPIEPNTISTPESGHSTTLLQQESIENPIRLFIIRAHSVRAPQA